MIVWWRTICSYCGGAPSGRRRRLRSGQGGPGGCGTTGAPSPERRALPRHRRLRHTRRGRASTADWQEMAAAGVLLQEAVGGGHQVLHLRQGAAGRLQRGQTFQVFTGGTTIPPAYRPQAARHIPVPHNAAVVGPPTAPALLHRRIHLRHPTHTGPGECGSGRLEPPAFCGRAATAAEPTSLSHFRRRGMAGGGAGGSGSAHPGCHRQCAAGRLFGDGRRPADLPGGVGDDELPHIADHNPGSRRHYAARGRFDGGVPPAGTNPTRRRFSSRCTLYTTRVCERPAASSRLGSAGHRWPKPLPRWPGPACNASGAKFTDTYTCN
jgi:hypothetical protein